MICLAVLVLDDELGTVLALGDDVDSPAARGEHFGLADCGEIYPEGIAEIVQLVGQ